MALLRLTLKSTDTGFCQDFVSMEKEGRKEGGQEFRSLEVREASSSHLKSHRNNT